MVNAAEYKTVRKAKRKVQGNSKTIQIHLNEVLAITKTYFYA
jgi:hypothetical protein